MSYNKLLNRISPIIAKSGLAASIKNQLSQKLRAIRKRTNDPHIYIGIIGEFSSGKSTLINSLIGADFFVTNSLQGTTTILTKLGYGKNVNMILTDKIGTKLSYRHNKRTILKTYLPEVYSQFTNFQKVGIFIKDLFYANGKDTYFMNVFEEVTTSNAISEQLAEVSVYYPCKILKDGIVIVDTPGTESLNPEHAKITQHAIKEICDTAIVIVPTTKPLSQTLVDFLDENMGEDANKCLFFITKIEILKKRVERTHILQGIRQRIVTYLGIDNPRVFPAPTLLSLEQRGIVENTGILNHLQEDERNELCATYERDLGAIVDEFSSNREATIHYTLNKFTQELTKELQSELSNKKEALNSELQTLRSLQTMPLATFMSDFFKQTEFNAFYNSVEAELANKCREECTSFKNHVINDVNNAKTKDAAQGVMDLISTHEYGQNSFVKCYDCFTSKLNALKDHYTHDFEDFKRSFTQTFLIEAIDFQYQLITKDSWKKQYDLNFSKAGLTTFPLFRCFKSLPSIKEQMRKEVTPKIDKAFSKMEASYVERIRSAQIELERQMNKVKAIFVKKYDKVIKKRIAEELRKEQQLSMQISQYQNLLAKVNDITNDVTARKDSASIICDAGHVYTHV